MSWGLSVGRRGARVHQWWRRSVGGGAGTPVALIAGFVEGGGSWCVVGVCGSDADPNTREEEPARVDR